MAGKNLLWGMFGVIFLLAGGGANAQNDPEPSGGEFLINAEVLGDDPVSPKVAADGAGGFVAVWEASDGSGKGIYARRFDPAGKPLGQPFLVNENTQDGQEKPAVASERDGDFVIVWQGPNLDQGTSWGIFARAYDQDGDPVTSELPVNVDFGNIPSAPVVAMAEGGAFLVVWQRQDLDPKGSGDDVVARLFGSDGKPDTSEFQLNQTEPGDQAAPAVAARRTAGGGYLVAWQGPDADDNGIYLQLISHNGVIQLQSEAAVNSGTTGDQTAPAVAASDIFPDSGSPSVNRLVVVWQGPNGGEQERIWYRLYSIAGVPENGEKQVDTDPDALGQREPAVAMSAADGAGLAQFAASWTQVVPNEEAVLGVPCLIRGAIRPRPNLGNPLVEDDPEFAISAPGPVTGASSLGMDAAGNFVAIWIADGPKGDGLDIYGRLFAQPLFTDGFESGGTKLWSQALSDSEP